MTTLPASAMQTQGLARVVTDLEHQVSATTRRVGPPDLNEVSELAERMRPFAGADLSALIERIWDARDAIDRTLSDIDRQEPPADLLDLTREQVAEHFRQSAQTQAATLLDNVGYSPARRTHERFANALAASACAALKPAADVVVSNMRPDFDKHVKVIKAATKAGIDESTDPTVLLEAGTPAQIAAFRNLSGSVAGLEQIAGLRLAITDVLSYGPREPSVLAFVTGLTNGADLQGAWNRYEDPIETVQYNQSRNGSALINVRGQRLGGRWLALVNAGHTLHLNTAAEAEAVYRATRGTD